MSGDEAEIGAHHMRREWLSKLKAGDQVVLSEGFGRELYIHAVNRVTPTQIVIGIYRFRRSSGDEIAGNRYHPATVLEPTPERVHQARVHQARRGLAAIRWNAIPEELLAVYAVLTSRGYTK